MYMLGLLTLWCNERLSINFILILFIELIFVGVAQVYCENTFLYMYVLLYLISLLRCGNVLYLAEEPLWNH